MTRINVVRVVLGGLLAGLVMNAIDFVVNGVLLMSEWQMATIALGIDPARVEARSAVGWIVFDFAGGIALVWLYAAMRPRFGPGPRTATTASLTLWGIVHLAFSSFVFMDLFPFWLVASSALGGLVSALVGGQVGCRIYREHGQETYT
jgi:hypothetical protein